MKKTSLAFLCLLFSISVFADDFHPTISAVKICAGNSRTFTDTYPHGGAGGTWSSSNAAIGTINTTTGVFTAISAGTTTISYTFPGGTHSKVVTVNEMPGEIIGATSVCTGASTTLSATPSGTWYSSYPSTAAIHPGTGVVTGVSNGVTTIRNIMANGCMRSVTVTVNAAPSITTGNRWNAVCTGDTTTYSGTPAGGTWMSANTAIASLSGSAGTIVGMSPGTTQIIYTNPTTGCTRSREIRVFRDPVPITGPSNVCPGSTINLVDTSTVLIGWMSSNPSVATVSGGSTATVVGVSAGTVVITFFRNEVITLGGFNCYVTKTITVGASISGNTALTAGNTTTLTGSPSGGTWSSSNPAIAAIGSASGVVSSVSVGTTTISYILPGGCTTTTIFSVTPIPSITGSFTGPIGGTTTLSATPAGGTWSSSAPSVATVSAMGVVNAVTTGTATISYSLAAGIHATLTVTVTAPAGISGSGNACVGSFIDLTGSPSGGTWSSSNSGIASVGSTGKVTGVTAGTATISYINGPGDFATLVVTVSATTKPIVGCIVDGPPTVFIFRNTSGFSGVTVNYTANIRKVVAGVTVDSQSNVGALPLSLATPALAETSVPIIDIAGTPFDISFPTNWMITRVNKQFVNYAGCKWVDACSMAKPEIPALDTDPVSGFITVKPNPSSGTFTITGTHNSVHGNLTLEVLDILGRLHHRAIITVNNDHFSHNVVLGNEAASGVYFLRISGREITETRVISISR